MTTDRCTLVRLDADDLERAADSPQLAALVRDGWWVVGQVLAEADGRRWLVLVLAPPRAPARRAAWTAGGQAALTTVVALAAALVGWLVAA